MSYATSLTSMVQQLALSTGVALGAFVLESVSLARGHATLTGADFAPAFLVIGTLSALSVLFFTRLDPDAGAEMSGHRAAPATTGRGGMRALRRRVPVYPAATAGGPAWTRASSSSTTASPMAA
jgi:hypothetical protein